MPKTVKWCQTIFSKVNKARTKALGYFVDGLLKGGKISVCNLGRSMRTRTTIKHNTKRIHRFIKNEKVVTSHFVTPLFETICNHTKQRIIVAVDWTYASKLPILFAEVISDGRAMPFHWKVAHSNQGYSQNIIEDQFFRELKKITKGYDVIILADRGFFRSPLAELLGTLGFNFIIRQPKTVCIYSDCYSGRLGKLEILGNLIRDIRYCRLTRKLGYFGRLVAVWDKKQKEAWYLATNLQELNAKTIVKMYGYRFRIEENFRDIKGVRWGWHLKQIGVMDSKRVSLLILIAAVAYLFIMLVGIWAERNGKTKHLVPSTRKRRILSLAFAGKLLFYKARLGLPAMLSFAKYLVVCPV